MDDVAADYNIRACDVINIAETALKNNDFNERYQLANFDLHRNDHVPYNSHKTPYGLAVYAKQSMPSTIFTSNFNGVELSVTKLHEPKYTVTVVSNYGSRLLATIRQLIEAIDQLHHSVLTIENHPIIILGDFNVNLLQPSSERTQLDSYMNGYRQYAQLINEYTTDYHTQLDHIYTNAPRLVLSSGVLESFYSDHKPIYVCFRT